MGKLDDNTLYRVGSVDILIDYVLLYYYKCYLSRCVRLTMLGRVALIGWPGPHQLDVFLFFEFIIRVQDTYT